ncbi:hypothetical protein AeMF1_001508 [Aphanomyces euteiches]|nr:hypothetical protein AeMF1_001508 [Aphanomyces euteiches]
MRLGSLLVALAACVECIVLPEKTDNMASPIEASASPAPVPVSPPPQAEHTPHGTIIRDDTSSDIAENVVELDMEGDQLHSKEVQDSDGGQRQNYASKDSGATVLDHAPGTKGSVNLLVPDKDRYMLIPCANDKKWVVISLSEDIHADAIAVANYEKFSSPMREFLVLGSINYPSDTWFVLGNFTAAHKSGEQLFEFQEKHHVRYIKLRIMSHYGSEYYCTMSQIKVFGRTFTQVISQLEKSIEAESNAAATPSTAPTVPTTSLPPKLPPPVCPAPAFSHIFLHPAGQNAEKTSSCEPSAADVNATLVNNRTTAKNVPPNATTSVDTTAKPPPKSQDKANATHPSTAAIDHDAKPNTTVDGEKETAPKAAPTTPNTNNNGGLDNFYIRMSKKLQVLEANMSSIERAIQDAQRTAGQDVQRLEAQLKALGDDMTALKAWMETELSVMTSSNDAHLQFVQNVHQENMALRVEVELLWDVIRTMKAGIMMAIILSAALIAFFICRWFVRCLTACHRRAVHREWFRRMDVAETEVSDDDEDINPLTQQMNQRVDRKLRFGISYDDGAIQRNTMYRRILKGFRQHHVHSTKTNGSTNAIKSAPGKSRRFSLTPAPTSNLSTLVNNPSTAAVVAATTTTVCRP